jgi:hypothetical protein
VWPYARQFPLSDLSSGPRVVQKVSLSHGRRRYGRTMNTRADPDLHQALVAIHAEANVTYPSKSARRPWNTLPVTNFVFSSSLTLASYSGFPV